jgi:5-formyltetrahydrofolate cyclo-ligase
MNKKQLRSAYSEKRMELDNSIRKSFLEKITLELSKFDLFQKHVSVYITIAHKNEIDTQLVIACIQNKGGIPVVPKANFQTGELTHYIYEGTEQLEVNEYGIPEPNFGEVVNTNQIELVIVPLLIFDLLGHRVGYGKGFYDRLLKDCNPSTLKIGICDFEPVEQIADVFEQDIALDFCITPKKTYSFAK